MTTTLACAAQNAAARAPVWDRAPSGQTGTLFSGDCHSDLPTPRNEWKNTLHRTSSSCDPALRAPPPPNVKF